MIRILMASMFLTSSAMAGGGLLDGLGVGVQNTPEVEIWVEAGSGPNNSAEQECQKKLIAAVTNLRSQQYTVLTTEECRYSKPVSGVVVITGGYKARIKFLR